MESTQSKTELFAVPPELFPSQNLTLDVAAIEGDLPLPFCDEPQYEMVFDQLQQSLHRQRRRHVLLVGERGVGQSAVVMEFARRASNGLIGFLQGKQFVWVDCRYTVAEEARGRLLALLQSIANRDDVVLCLEGMAALLRGNQPTLFAALSNVAGRVLGLVSTREHEELLAGDLDADEFFSVVPISEPEIPVALKLMQHFAAGLEQQYDLQIEPEAVERAVVLTSNYILNERLPAKALNILHTVCEDIDYERVQLGSARRTVSVLDVVRDVSRVSGVPEETLRGIARRTDYEQSLAQSVFGQDHAVREVASELGLIKAGLTDPGKPASVILFVGPTGTGKTELAKILARFYSASKRLKTFTLGNFGEPHSVSGIIGVPAGYVGHDQGGRLINEMNSDPYGVFLLDEADKAHPDVMQPFLNLFDEGWILDQRGVKAYGDKSIFILTTNVGQRQIVDMCRKGNTIEEITSRIKETLSQIKHTKSNRPVFTPEFLARLKRVIVFGALDEDAMVKIAQRLTGEMQANWRERRGKLLQIDAGLVQRIGELAYQRDQKSNSKEGGRIVRKLIADLIEVPLQREISLHPESYQGANGIAIRPVDETSDDVVVMVEFLE